MDILKRISVVCLSVAFLIGCSSGDLAKFQSNNTSHSLRKNYVYGTWNILKMSDGDGKVSMTEKEAKSYLGKRIKIKKNYLKTVGNRTCRNPSYSYRVEKNVNKYLFDFYRLSLKDLPINVEQLHTFSVSCDDSPMTDIYYLTDSDRIMVLWDGYWYFAERPPWSSRLYSWCLSWF